MRKGVGMTVRLSLLFISLSLLTLQTGVVKADEDEKKVGELIEKLKDLDRYVRRDAAEALRKIPNKEVLEKYVPRLVEVLEDQEPFVRMKMTEILSELPDKGVLQEYVPRLVRAIKDPNLSVQRGVVAVLKGIPNKKVLQEYVPQWVQDLKDKELSVRIGAAAALRGLGDKKALRIFVPDLAKQLENLEPAVRTDIAYTLAKLGGDAKPAIPELVKALKDYELSVRRGAAAVFKEFPDRKVLKDHESELKKSLEDSDSVVQADIAYALGRVSGNVKHIPDLLQDLKDKKDLPTRRGAAAVLREFRDKKALRDFVKRLAESLKDSDPVVRTDIAYALAKLRGGVSPAIPQLMEALRDRESSVRRGVAFALWELGGYAKDSLHPFVSKPFGSPLADALKDKDPEVRRYIAFALAKLGGDAREAIVPLVGALKDKEVEVRRAAAFALRKIGAEALESIRYSIRELVEALTDEDKEVRSEILALLRELRKHFESEMDSALKGSEKLQIICSGTDPEFYEVRKFAIEVLRDITLPR